MNAYPKYVIAGILMLLLISGCSAETEEQATVSEDSGPSHAQYPEDGIMDLYLYAEETTLNHLYSRDPDSNDRVNGYVTLGPGSEERLELEGFRFRGNSARHLPKKSFNLEFEEELAFLFGSNRMNLNGMYRDPSMMREKLSWAMFEELGMPAPRAKYFNLYINDRFEGLYVHVERVDQNLLTYHDLNPEGTLVRDRMRQLEAEGLYDVRSIFSQRVSGMSEPAEALSSIFDSRGNPNYRALYDMIDAVQTAEPGDEFLDVFETHFDEETFLDWLAVHYLIGDIDAFGDDYWMYLDHEDPDAKWLMIPWDKNLTFGSYTRSEGGVTNDYFHYEYDSFELWDNDLLRRFFETPELEGAFNDRVTTLREDVFPREFFESKIGEYLPLIEESVLVPPSDDSFHWNVANHFGELAHYHDRLDVLMTYIDLRYAFLDERSFRLAEEESDSGDEAPYTAVKSDFTEGEKTWFTSSDGFVLGYVIPEMIEGDPEVRLSVTENPDVYGIDRDYLMELSEGSIAGKWGLFYRNDIGWLSNGNWYVTHEAVGDQYNLNAVVDERLLETETNPYVNRAVFDFHVEGDALIQLTLDR